MSDNEDNRKSGSHNRPRFTVVKTSKAKPSISFSVPLVDGDGNLTGFRESSLADSLGLPMMQGFAGGVIKGNFDRKGTIVKSPSEMGPREREALLKKLVNKGFQVFKPRDPIPRDWATGLSGTPGLAMDDALYGYFLDGVSIVLQEQGFTPTEIGKFKALAKQRKDKEQDRSRG